MQVLSRQRHQPAAGDVLIEVRRYSEEKVRTPLNYCHFCTCRESLFKGRRVSEQKNGTD